VKFLTAVTTYQAIDHNIRTDIIVINKV